MRAGESAAPSSGCVLVPSHQRNDPETRCREPRSRCDRRLQQFFRRELMGMDQWRAHPARPIPRQRSVPLDPFA